VREISWILEKSIILPFDVVIGSLNILYMVLMTAIYHFMVLMFT